MSPQLRMEIMIFKLDLGPLIVAIGQKYVQRKSLAFDIAEEAQYFVSTLPQSISLRWVFVATPRASF